MNPYKDQSVWRGGGGKGLECSRNLYGKCGPVRTGMRRLAGGKWPWKGQRIDINVVI
jgi:hypothetical protein